MGNYFLLSNFKQDAELMKIYLAINDSLIRLDSNINLISCDNYYK